MRFAFVEDAPIPFVTGACSPFVVSLSNQSGRRERCPAIPNIRKNEIISHSIDLHNPDLNMTNSTNLFDLSGKVGFVTGGNGGIGLGIALGYVQHGASVAIAARNPDKLEAAVMQLVEAADGNDSRVLPLECDVTDRLSVQSALDATMEKLGGWDIIVNNAGTNRRSDEPQNLSDDDWRYVIDTNLTAIHNVSSLTFPHLKEKGAGKYINIGSMMSIFGTAYASAYAASKGGVVQYTKSCAVAWARHNVQANAILPGWIVTEMTDQFKQLFPERYQLVQDRTPADRWGIPSDLAGTALFLASPASDFVTGTSIPVDGGYSVW